MKETLAKSFKKYITKIHNVTQHFVIAVLQFSPNHLHSRFHQHQVAKRY